jgi:hypothetical protein
VSEQKTLSAEEKKSLIERRNKDERVLIYRNLLMNVPVWRVMEIFRKSEKEVMAHLPFHRVGWVNTASRGRCRDCFATASQRLRRTKPPCYRS